MKFSHFCEIFIENEFWRREYILYCRISFGYTNANKQQPNNRVSAEYRYSIDRVLLVVWVCASVH